MNARTLFGAGTIALGLALSMDSSALTVSDPIEDTVAGCDPLDPSVCLLPWPNDFFTVADGSANTGRRLAVSPLATPRNAAGVPVDPTDWNRNDGFSPGSPIVVHVHGLDTPDAFDITHPVPINDIGRYTEPNAPVVVIDAATGQRQPIWAELDRSPNIDPSSVDPTADLTGPPPPPDRTALLIRLAINFREGHRYIVALRNLKDANGAAIHANPAFQAFIDGSGTPAARQAHYDRNIFPVLANAGIARSSLVLAWDFTVASRRNLTERLLFLRNDAFAKLGDVNLSDGIVQGASPAFVVDTVTPCRPESGTPPSCKGPVSDPRILRHVEGRVFVPCYLNQPDCPSGSRFFYPTPQDTIPTPIPGNTIAANFECNIPAGAADGQTFRPSLNGHGLFGSADGVNSGKFFELGKFGLMLCATDEIGMASEDVPNALAVLGDLSRFSTLPDRLQQGMLNMLYLGRAMIHPDGFCSDPAFQVTGRCVIDRSNLYYDGGSQGAIFGGALTAVAPDFTRSALTVAGMNYSTLLTRSSDFDIFAQVLYRAYPDPLERQLLYSALQLLWDRGDTDGYAWHVTGDPLPDTPSHSTLMIVSFGDHQVTNWASEVEMRTLGAVLRRPTLDPGRYPGRTPYWNIPDVPSYPFTGPIAAVIADVGPLRPCTQDATACSGGQAGTTPPPLANSPNRPGVDPHGPDWAEQADGIAAVGKWLRPDGALDPVCGDHPCYLAGYSGPDPSNTLPVAVLSADVTSGAAPLTVRFDASASSDPDAGDRVTLYTFDFGDGSPKITRDAPTIAHSYNNARRFRASVTVTDSRGAASGNNAQEIIQVTETAPRR